MLEAVIAEYEAAPGLPLHLNPRVERWINEFRTTRRDEFQNLLDRRGEGGRIDNGTVVMAGGRIQAIGGPDTPIPEGAVRIDGRGRWVTPGIIDTHSHIMIVATPPMIDGM